MADPIKIAVDLKIVTCSCGSVYAVPHWVGEYRCPMCATRHMQEAAQTEADLNDQLFAKERSISSLRGALTRAKRRSKR